LAKRFEELEWATRGREAKQQRDRHEQQTSPFEFRKSKVKREEGGKNNDVAEASGTPYLSRTFLFFFFF
jgi:hypothetical protein